jgi:hypothetical protein
MLEQKATPQDGIGGFSQGVPLARPQRAVGLEEGRHHAVSGLVQPQNGLQQGGSQIEKSARMHARIIPVRLRALLPLGTAQVVSASNPAQNRAS